jgi:hypothetical protein
MRLLICLLFLFAQFSILAQEEDYNDYRRKSESFVRIYDKALRADVASFAIGGIEESLSVPVLKKLPIRAYGSDFVQFDSAGIRVLIQSAVFDPSRHKLAFEAKRLVKIDNKPFFGNYFKVPTTRVSRLTVVLGKDTLAIPPSAIVDLYNPGFVFHDASGNLRSQDAVYLSADKRRIYIYMLNKDDTGSYEVTWVIQDRAYLRRVLDFGFSN